ncbi:MAG: exonuclease domain-containing protein [Lactobacillaceae bacterium]|jgi:inhibitor of KinA sporulation pathway (predicted exonuclease)|nr:exonuclease domain-containing protein [Lactobacillaceae bacterium]
MTEQFVIFDTEYTSWKGCMENGRAEWQKEEIVQIAAIKVDAKTLKVLEEFNVYVTPVINPILSDYFINLTGLTNELIEEQGVPFEQAYWQFKDFSAGLTCFAYDMDYGRISLADGEIMEKNLSFAGMEDKYPPRYSNIAEWFKKRYAENAVNAGKINSGGTAKLLGVSKELEQLGLDEHNALYDVYSLLAGIKYFKAKDLFSFFA